MSRAAAGRRAGLPPLDPAEEELRPGAARRRADGLPEGGEGSWGLGAGRNVKVQSEAGPTGTHRTAARRKVLGKLTQCALDPATGEIEMSEIGQDPRQGGDGPCDYLEIAGKKGGTQWGAPEDSLKQVNPAALSAVEVRNVMGVPGDLLRQARGITHLELRNNTGWPYLAGLPLQKLRLKAVQVNAGDPTTWDGDPFSGLQDLKELSVSECGGLTRFPADAFRELTSLMELYISKCPDLVALPDDWSAMRDLEIVVILETGLTALGPGWFKNKPQLKTIRLKQNKIASISSDTFVDDLPKVEVVDLEENRIGRIERGSRPFRDTFKGLGHLGLLKLGYNRITHLPPGVFDGLKNCYFLKVEEQGGEGLRELHPQLLRKMVSLTSIRFLGNQFRSLPRDLLRGLTLMTKVDFSRNAHLRGLPGGFFRDTPDLAKLYLYGTRISQLTPRMFGRLAKLGKLRIENCEITRIDPATFSGWTGLTELDLAGNALMDIGVGTFVDLVSLKSLKLRGNRLMPLPKDTLCPLTGLTQLTLSQGSPSDGADREPECVRVKDFPAPERVGKLMAAGCFKYDSAYRRCMDPDDPIVRLECASTKRPKGTSAEGDYPKTGLEPPSAGPRAGRPDGDGPWARPTDYAAGLASGDQENGQEDSQGVHGPASGPRGGCPGPGRKALPRLVPSRVLPSGASPSSAALHLVWASAVVLMAYLGRKLYARAGGKARTRHPRTSHHQV